MLAAARASDRVTAVGYTYRRSPAASAIGQLIEAGTIGKIIHFGGHYLADYALDPQAPLTWRYTGGPGSGALADVGSHLVDLAEQLIGPASEVSGAAFATVITQRPVPAGDTIGHQRATTTGENGPVSNEDVAAFTARFASGAVGAFSVSRVAHDQPDGLGFEVYGTSGSARFDLQRASEFAVSTVGADPAVNGTRRVLIGPEHPYIRQGLPMDVGGVGHGIADMFAYQARSFLDQIAGIDALPHCADFEAGLRGLAVLAAVTESAAGGGAAVKVG
jgi:predicted dehydrogenase